MTEMASIAVVTLHLLAAHFASAGPLAADLLKWLSRRDADAESKCELARLALRLARVSLIAMVMAVLLGLIQLAMLWTAPTTVYFEALQAVPRSRLWFAVAELGFSAVLLIAYVVAWHRADGWPKWHSLLAVVAATNLLYHFPVLFTILSVVATRPASLGGPIDIRAMLFDAEVMARVGHHLLTAGAVAGVAVVVLAWRSRPGQSWEKAMTLGARIAILSVLAQFLAGVAVLACVPPGIQNRLFGGDVAATVLLLAAIAAAVGLAHTLGPIALGVANRAAAARSLVLLIVVVGLMVATRHQSRRPFYASTASADHSRSSASTPDSTHAKP